MKTNLLSWKPTSRTISLFLLAVSGAAGCASANFNPRIEFIGKYRDAQQLEEKAAEMKWAEAEEVEVFVGEFPKGVTYNDGQIKIAEDSEYELVAKVHTNMKDAGWSFMGLWGYDYPEDESWRR